jgi:hypothetical protein
MRCGLDRGFFEMSDLVSAVAFAIYQTWSRERDPARALQRFKRLPTPTREQFEAEAKAAVRVAEVYFRGAFAA